MKLKKEAPSKNVSLDKSMYPQSNTQAKGSGYGYTVSNHEGKSGRKDRIYNSPEYKKALNDLAVQYNKKIGSGKGNRVK